MTLPTCLTLSRVVLTLAIIALIYLPGAPAAAWALAAFALAGMTDWLDGYLARRWGQTSPLGALLDPIADKIFVLGIFLAFVERSLAPVWMVLVIAVREVSVTGTRLFLAGRGRVVAAAPEGKQKLVSQLVAIGAILVARLAGQLGGGEEPAALRLATQASLWAAVVLTVISGAGFFWHHRTVLNDAIGR